MIVRTGIDLLEIRRLDDLRPAIRERFYARVYTEREVEICGARTERYAARFAAKEAVSKALGTGIDEVSWKEIEIDIDVSGAPVLKLNGKAAELAKELGLTSWAISLTHTKSYAAASAVAIGPGAEA